MISKLYSQVDSRWSKQILGFNTDPGFDLGNFGCVVTAYGNLLCAITGDMHYTPAYINDWMKQHNGFMPESGLFVWSEAVGLGHVEDHGVTKDLVQVNRWLQDPPNFAILGVNPSKKGEPTHFVMAPYVNKIVDSEDGLLKNMGTYPFVSAHLYRSTDKVNETIAPAPAQPKTSGWAQAQPVVDGNRTFLNLRQGPGTNFPIGKGKDDNGNVIYSIPYGAEFQYINVVDAAPNSPVKGKWLETDRKNYVLAAATNYQA